jgi:hypothetical protein
VLKVVVVFEAVAHHPVEGRVREPYEADPKDQRPVLPPPQTDDECCRVVEYAIRAPTSRTAASSRRHRGGFAVTVPQDADAAISLIG